MAPVSRGRVDLFDNRNDMSNVHRFSFCSGLSGITMATDSKHVFVPFYIASIKFVNIFQEINLAGNPSFSIYKTTMVNNFVAHDGLNFRFHCVLGVDDVCHNTLFFSSGNRPGPSGCFLNPLQRYNKKCKNQKFYHNFFNFLHFFSKSPSEWAIFAIINPKILGSCQYTRHKAVGNGAKPERFTRPKPKPKHKAAPFTPRAIVKRPQPKKRNRNSGILTEIPYLCCVFIYRIAHNGIDRPARIRSGGVPFTLSRPLFPVCVSCSTIRRVSPMHNISFL